MIGKYPPINPKFPHFMHGGDYNPDQWRETPDIWDEDMRLMKLAHCNTMSVGIFSWTALEPEEGHFDFQWLDEIMDKLADNGGYAVLATPSGSKPAWLSQKYPEILRVKANRVRDLHGLRHNHCLTSPVYREKCKIINRKLADRYKSHPALLVWHISNEYGGECHCPLCQEAFRNWLKNKYENDLDKLNHEWWTGFWSHRFTDWSQIDSPAPHGESMIHGMNLDWKRFITDQTIDFMMDEAAPLKEITPDIPVTTNLMGFYPGLNYWKFAPYMDVISWDNYPAWHGEIEDWKLASRISMIHDLNRSLKGGKPFMLMESTPSATNWQPISKLKKPGMHILSSVQAVAHGADTVQYFQWRKSRGASEKFHGAVVDHCGHENTRVFREVADLGMILEKLDPVIGAAVRPEAAVIFDWENRWAMEDAQGPRNKGLDYEETVLSHYRVLWKRGIPTDVINMDCDFSAYKLIVAPLLYMLRPGVAERVEKFVEAGGTFVTTYWSGIVNENDLCFLGGFPGPLRKVLGVWSEEIDSLYDNEHNSIKFTGDSGFNFGHEYKSNTLCDLIHAETAQVLAAYQKDFYKGRPALTVNSFGKGKAYYVATKTEDDFLEDFYEKVIRESGLKPVLNKKLPEGVTVQLRGNGTEEFIFVMNFTDKPQNVELDERNYTDMLNYSNVGSNMELPPFGIRVLKRI